ncbi:MAG: cell envelope integrity protein CreD [Gammaproteobacteria bacterium]|nr:MAG: cell envelope integrity protein CreD [Gammaproteobacteria bacterium]
MKLEWRGASGGTGRFFFLCLLVLAMFIPLSFVDGVTEERQSYFERTLNDVAKAWGGEQVLNGPYLVIPETLEIRGAELVDGKQTRVVKRERRVVLPSSLNLEVTIEHQLRRRALYEVPVYTAVLKVQGEFPTLNRKAGIGSMGRLDLDAARFVLGISHTRSIGRVSNLSLAGKQLDFESGSGEPWLGSGIHTAVPSYDGSRAQAFEFEIELKGTRSLGLTPVGAESRIDMSSSWPHPSFKGQYLPERYQVEAGGFSARWSINELARDLPGSWLATSEKPPAAATLASVRLFQPVTGYKVVGVLFIALTFITFVCFELTLGFQFHPVHYGVVGIALVLFYLTLLSLSEHLPFGAAYGLATALLTGMIAWYVQSLSGSRSLMRFTAVVIGTLYGVLYVLLKLETFALLVGTAVLLLGLFGLMFATRSLKLVADR